MARDSEDELVPPSVKVAMSLLRHFDIVRSPVVQDAAIQPPGRDLSDTEAATERAALDLIRHYFELNDPANDPEKPGYS